MNFDLEGAGSLPPLIRFGTSTWTYPGWRGQIYHRSYKSERDFNARSLEEYASCPLFRSVGIDSAFYGPLKPELLRSYASMVPAGFQWIAKVWERISIPVYPGLPRYGKLAGQVNPHFLSSSLFQEEFLPSFDQVEVRPFCGPFVFQFPTLPKHMVTSGEFVSRLSEFLRTLPTRWRYAVEVRNPDILNRTYFEALNASGATHCFNHWYLMPSLKDQMIAAAQAGGLSAPFFVARILTPLGVKYEDAVKLFQPYDSVKLPNEAMRRDIVRLAKRALERGSEAFIIVNNRSEGNAPGTIDAIGRVIRSEMSNSPPST